MCSGWSEGRRGESRGVEESEGRPGGAGIGVPTQRAVSGLEIPKHQRGQNGEIPTVVESAGADSLSLGMTIGGGGVIRLSPCR